MYEYLKTKSLRFKAHSFLKKFYLNFINEKGQYHNHFKVTIIYLVNFVVFNNNDRIQREL